MRVVIIEDEKAAVRNLRALLEQVAPQSQIIAEIDSVTEAIRWFGANDAPDVVFMDIHLSDGSSFEIFENCTVPCPIIFTTAYDEYAIKAFKVNSVDYLLKPISSDELKAAIDKFLQLNTRNTGDTAALDRLMTLMGSRRRTTHFLIPVKGDKLYPLSAASIRYCFIDEGVVKAVNEHGEQFIMQHTLDELSQSLDSDRFFRANRQYIITREAVEDIDLWFNNRLSINLKKNGTKIIISRERVSEFKSWFAGEIL